MPLSSTEKAAILLISLGEEVAAEVFRKLSPNEVRRIGSALGRLNAVDQATIDIVVHEFLGLLQTKKPTRTTDGVAFAQRAIQLAFKNEEGSKLSEAIAKSHVTLRAIERVDAETLARVLRQEHPQSIALVLAHCKPEQGAKLISFLPESLRSDLLLRVAQMGPVDPDVILELDAHLSREIERVGIQQGLKVGGPKQVASILNYLDQEGKRILEGLEEKQAELADNIRSLMFTFEDLSLLDDRALQELIKLVPRGTLTLALRGVSEELSVLFYRNMSKRSAETMQEDLAAMGQQKREDVLKAQREVLDCVKKLEEQGKILIERNQKQVI